MCSREDALKTIVFNSSKYGRISFLQEKIGEDLFVQFRVLGYIREVKSSNLNEEPKLWERTKLADDDYKFYDPSFNPVRRDLETATVVIPRISCNWPETGKTFSKPVKSMSLIQEFVRKFKLNHSKSRSTGTTINTVYPRLRSADKKISC